MASPTKTALQVALTLGLVGFVYGAPWLLAAAGAGIPRMSVEGFDVPEDRFATDVVWTPPVLPEPPADAQGEPTEAAAAQTQVAVAPPPTALTSPVGTPIAATSTPLAAPPMMGGTPTTEDLLERAKAARRGKKRVARAPRELTKKQQRRRNRRKRQRERMADQPQCHELVDQVVQISEDEWWVGRDLAGCYRSYPRQFARIGGLRWVEDEDDKRVGLRVYVSRRTTGDVARAVGFRRGDVLRSLNGMPLRTKAGSGFAMLGLLGNKAKVKFLRDGQEHRVTLRVVGQGKLERARSARLLAEADGS